MGTVISPWVIIVACLLVQAFLVVATLAMREKKRRAETESKRLSALAQSEYKRLDAVVSNVPGVVWETRTDPLTHHQRTVFVSQPAEPMLGYPREKWLSTPNFCFQLVHDADRDRVERECEEILLSRKQGVLNFRWVAKDNRTVWVRAQLAAIVDDTGRTIGCQGVTIDMTEQQLAEDAWRQSEENNQATLEALTRNEAQLAGIIDSAMDAIITTDESQNIVLFNTAAEKLFSCSSAEALGHSINRFIPERFRRVYEEHMRKFVEEGGTPRLNGSSEELYGLRTSGEEFPMEASISQIEIGGRKLYTVILRDITKTRQAVDQLRESEERFRNLADSAPAMIWLADPENRCTYVNKQWLDFTGRTADEELGAGWMRSVHPEDYDACLVSLESSFDARRRFELEFRLRRHDGEYRWLYSSGIPRFSSDDAFLGYIGSSIDITERKASEVALRAAHEELHQLKNQLEAENIYLQQELQRDEKFGEIVGQSDAIKYVLFKITQVAPTDSTVLIAGETGTGKELVARAIHGASSRKERPLIKVNCAVLSPTLIESELFGHEKGAFTGAIGRKQGRFELANGGTIFLDEIGELPLELQVKLLRVIQESEFERLGGNRTIKVDVRIIAATNRNLKLEVEQGTFREDLWYRLNVYPITMPPLRQRKDDIPLLVEHFVATYARKAGKTISSVSPREMQTLEEVEREYILRTLESTGWRVEGKHGAAKVLGLNPSTLRTRMMKLGIQRRRAIYG